MNQSNLSLDSFGFSKEEIVLLMSITYHGVIAEANQSESFSRVRKYFRNEDSNGLEMMKYRCKKWDWAKHWKELTFKLLDIREVIELPDLAGEMLRLSPSDSKKNAMIVELACFEPYFNLTNGEDMRGI